MRSNQNRQLTLLLMLLLLLLLLRCEFGYACPTEQVRVFQVAASLSSLRLRFILPAACRPRSPAASLILRDSSNATRGVFAFDSASQLRVVAGACDQLVTFDDLEQARNFTACLESLTLANATNAMFAVPDVCVAVSTSPPRRPVAWDGALALALFLLYVVLMVLAGVVGWRLGACRQPCRRERKSEMQEKEADCGGVQATAIRHTAFGKLSPSRDPLTQTSGCYTKYEL